MQQIADEGFFQRGRAALGYQGSGGIAVEHPAGVHHGHAVAPLGLVHEVGGDEDRHLVAARQFHQQLPELVACHGIDARGRLVQDEQLGPVHHGHGQRQALAQAQGQALGQGFGLALQAKALQHFLHALFHVRFGDVKELGVQH